MTDPAGLDEAIEAARSRVRIMVSTDDDTYEDATIRHAVRAAAPHIRRAVLLEAADEIKTKLRAEYVGIMWAGLTRAERMLRERAEREVPGE